MMKQIRKKSISGFVVLLALGFFFYLTAGLMESSFAQTKPAAEKVKPAEVKAKPAEKTKPVAAKPKPKVPQKLIVASGTDALTMDTHFALDAPTFTILDHMVESLLELTPTGEIVPRLAEKWEVSSDATEFTLKLRKGITFHDGTTFNAEAVKVTFDRLLDPKVAIRYRFLVAPISTVTVVDDYTVKMKTKAPFAALVSNLTHQATGIQSPASLKASWDKAVAKPVGTGSFMFKEWVPGNKFVMARNDNYWGKKPLLEEVTWRVIPDEASRVVALETGEVQVAVRIPPFDIPRLKADKNLVVLSAASVRTIYLGFNALKEPFQDKRVRQAINYAVNKEAIVKHVLGGVGRVSDAAISPGIFGYAPIKTYEYNIEKAKALLAEAGFPKGFETTLHPAVGRYYMDASVCTAVAADLLKVGIKADIKMMEWGTYLPSILREKEQVEHKIYMLGWGCVTGDADYGLYTLFHSGEWPKKGMNASFYKNEKLDQLLDGARSTANPEERKKLYKEALTLINEEAPWLFLHSEVQMVGTRANVKGIIVHPTERVIAKEAWIE